MGFKLTLLALLVLGSALTVSSLDDDFFSGFFPDSFGGFFPKLKFPDVTKPLKPGDKFHGTYVESHSGSGGSGGIVVTNENGKIKTVKF